MTSYHRIDVEKLLADQPATMSPICCVGCIDAYSGVDERGGRRCQSTYTYTTTITPTVVVDGIVQEASIRGHGTECSIDTWSTGVRIGD
jgi:hypothetical protein